MCMDRDNRWRTRIPELGLSREKIEARLPAMLEFAGIGDFIDMPIKTYSTGMSVRLAFAVIAHVDADILIIDEGLAVGDAFFVQRCITAHRHDRHMERIAFARRSRKAPSKSMSSTIGYMTRSFSNLIPAAYARDWWEYLWKK